MARRVLEAHMLSVAGIVQKPMAAATSVQVVREIRLHKTANGVFSLQFNFSGELLAVGLGAGGIQIFETQSGRMVNELRPCRVGGFAVMSLRFHPKEPNILYAATTEGNIHVYNVKTGLEVATIEEGGNEINTMDFSVDGYNFATGGKDLGVRVYETNSNKLIKLWPGTTSRTILHDHTTVGNTMRIFAIKFHPINQYIFVSGGWDNHLKIWDVRDNEGIKRNIRGPHICGDSIDVGDIAVNISIFQLIVDFLARLRSVVCHCFLSGWLTYPENEILSGQWAALHALQEYNYTSGAVTRELKFPHTEGAFLYTAQYCNINSVIAGGSGTNSAEVIEISTNRHVGGYHMASPVHTVDSTHQGRLLAAAGGAPVLGILEVTE